MKTIIEFTDGHSETVEDACPYICDGEVACLDKNDNALCDVVPLTMIKRVIFEAEGLGR